MDYEDNDHVTGWKRASANSTSPGTGSAKIDFYNSPGGQIDVLYPLFPLDFTTATSPNLSFDVAHQRYALTGQNSNDRLDVIVSTDCGATWTSVWSKSGAALATVATANTNPYTPALTGWRWEYVDLSAYIGQSNVLTAFKATSDYGNNAYIDRINVSQVLGVETIPVNSSVNLYPSPSNGNVNINLEKIAAAKMEITVTNVVGKVIKQMTYDKSEGNIFSLDLSNEATGNYIVKIVTANETILKRAIIQK